MRNYPTAGALFSMPRYHFHLVDGTEVFDSRGVLLPNDAAAHAYAESLAAEFAGSDTMLKIRGVRVTNEAGELLFRLPVDRRNSIDWK